MKNIKEWQKNIKKSLGVVAQSLTKLVPKLQPEISYGLTNDITSKNILGLNEF